MSIDYFEIVRVLLISWRFTSIIICTAIKHRHFSHRVSICTSERTISEMREISKTKFILLSSAPPLKDAPKSCFLSGKFFSC